MDPLAAIVALLRPRMVDAKIVSGAGRWAVRYDQTGGAGFGLVLEGEAHLAVEDAPPIHLRPGDFVLIPLGSSFTMGSDAGARPVLMDAARTSGLAELRHGDPDGEASFRLLGGYFAIDPTNAALLADLAPTVVHVRSESDGAGRLARLIDLAVDEARSDRPGRDLIVERLVDALLLEALRIGPRDFGAPPRTGLLDGLADRHVGCALRCIHSDVARRWTVADLAREAGLSRSAFSDRFAAKVGLPPMEYLIQWRIALAKDMLQRERIPLEAAAAAIGYESASAFSTAFTRRVGLPPSRFARKGLAGIAKRPAQ